MLRTSLTFVGVAVLAILFADIEISTLSPWEELGKVGVGLVTPEIHSWQILYTALLNTLVFSLCGTFLAVFAGSLLAFFFEFAPVRLFCAFIRSIHEIFWAFIFLPVVGLNPVCGILAIAVPFAGIYAKVYAEIRQESDQRPLRGIPAGAPMMSRFFYGILPVIYTDIRNYTSYRLECALRSSAVLGFIGLPTIGFYLETAFRRGFYSEAAGLLYAFYLLIATKKYWASSKMVVIPLLLAACLMPKETAFSVENMTRFFTYEIIPWPMRREGFFDGTYAISFQWLETWRWFVEILLNDGAKGAWNTIIVTQIAMVLTGMLALAAFAPASRHFSGWAGRKVSHGILIVLRTTPEYILAYLFVQLLGPSMLPGILALALPNSGTLAYLTSNNADLIPARIDAAKKRTDRYLFEILPRVYGQFLAFLFYRWEILMRESAILGILGIYTLGFYIDSAISDDKMDKAIVLILVTALLNMAIDTISQFTRRRLKISTKIETHA